MSKLPKKNPSVIHNNVNAIKTDINFNCILFMYLKKFLSTLIILVPNILIYV